jgi:hypothetical protein
LQDDLHEQIDFMNHLASAPDDVVLDLVHQMRRFGNQHLITNEVEQGLYKRCRQPSISEQAIVPVVSSPRFHIDFDLELSACFPKAYPVLPPINTSGISINGLFAARRNLAPPLASLIKTPYSPTMPYPSPPAEEQWQVGAVQPMKAFDDRFTGLNISYWTSVPISDEFAASVLTLYMKVDHPIYGFMDMDLFIRDLVACRSEFCSPFLVAALMFYGCVSTPA